MSSEKIRILVVGVGNMGASHASAYHPIGGSRSSASAHAPSVTLPATLHLSEVR